MTLVAADTFRAAAIDQLEAWAKRVDVPLIRQARTPIPRAVVYDAVRAVKGGRGGVIIVDTAGRLHTKVNLMEELKKMRRIMGAGAPRRPRRGPPRPRRDHRPERHRPGKDVQGRDRRHGPRPDEARRDVEGRRGRPIAKELGIPASLHRRRRAVGRSEALSCGGVRRCPFERNGADPFRSVIPGFGRFGTRGLSIPGGSVTRRD